MRAIVTEIGGAKVLIEEFKVDHVVAPAGEGRKTISTGVGDDFTDAYKKAKDVIRSIATDFGGQFASLADAAMPKECELEFGLGFSTEANAWVISGKAECSLKVTLKWSK